MTRDIEKASFIWPSHYHCMSTLHVNQLLDADVGTIKEKR